MSSPENSKQAPPFSIQNPDSLKLFALETDRLVMAYESLQEQFKSLQRTLHDSHTKWGGKLAELDFTSRYLGTILHHISQGILFIDLNCIVTTYNEAAQRLLGIPEKDLLFHAFTEFFEDTFFGFSLKQALLSKKCPKNITLSPFFKKMEKVEWAVEFTFICRNENSFSAAFHPSPLISVERQSQTSKLILSPIQGLLILIHDLTPIRHLEQVVHRSDRLKELGEMAAHLAHELRNPLGGIKGFASILREELKDKPDLYRMAESIEQGSDELNTFVTQVLDYTRPFQTHFQNVDLVPFLEEIKSLMQADPCWRSTIHFSLFYDKNSIFATIDPLLLKIAILNLSRNAIQAMPQGGEIEIKLREDDQEVLIEVRDTGEGIPDEYLPKLFTPFFTTKAEGSGLGLAEVQKIVQAHQGTIHMNSIPNQGTIFYIRLPLKYL